MLVPGGSFNLRATKLHGFITLFYSVQKQVVTIVTAKSQDTIYNLCDKEHYF